MSIGYEVFKIAKKQGEFVSDYELCKKLGISMQKVNNWKNDKSNPNTLTFLKLIKEADIDIDHAIDALEKERGFAHMSLIFVTALTSLLVIASTKADLICILCKITRWQCLT